MRLIFFRTGAIGDIIHVLPALKYIKKENPSYRIDLVIKTKPLLEVFSNYVSFIDNVYNVEKKIFSNSELIDSLAEETCDEFIYLHSNWWKGWYFNYKYFKAGKFKAYKKDLDLSSRENFLTAYDSNLKAALQDKSLVLDSHCLVAKQGRKLGQEPSNKETFTKKKYIVIVPGVGKLRPQRAYPLKEWMILIKKFIAETDYDLKILGGPDEIEISLNLSLELKLRSKENTRIENLIGKLSLLETTDVLAGAEAVYSADTGLLHIASALDKVTYSTYTVTSEFRTGPYSAKAEVFRSSFCKCADLKNFNDNKTKCKYLGLSGLPRCVDDLKYPVLTASKD